MLARATLLTFGCGVALGGGLAVSGLTQPAVVLGFLDVAGRWNPTMGVVMVVAVVVNAVAVRVATQRRRPVWARRFSLPDAAGIDRRLLAGATLFGIGWGLVGVCPGPAVASISSGQWSVLTFVLSMVAGLGLVDAVARHARRDRSKRSAG